MRTPLRLIFVAVFFLACSDRQEQELPRQPASKPVVRLATSKNVWCTLTLLASDLGYFSAENLDVRMLYLDAGRYCMDALVSRSADIGTLVEVNIGFLGYTGDKNVSAIATIARTGSSAIVAKKSAKIKMPADLRGKRLGISPATTSEVFAYRFLEKYKIPSGAVTFEKLQPVALVAGMTSGDLPAASTWEPFATNITRGLKDDAIVFTAPDAYTGYENIAVRNAWASAHHDEMTRFLRALGRAHQYTIDHPADAQQRVARLINLDPAVVSAIWPQFDFKLDMNRDELLRAVTRVGEWIRVSQEPYKAKPVPDYAPYIDASYMTNVK